MIYRKILFVALAAMAVTATAYAQEAEQVSAKQLKKEKFYSVVPKHEFTINGFGGVSTLIYRIDMGYSYYSGRPIMRGEEWSDFVNLENGLYNPTGIGGGGGFSYIWHFHPNVGLMTGLDFAYYSGGVRNLGGNAGNVEQAGAQQPFTTAYIVTEKRAYGNNPYPVYYGVCDYTEMQEYMALQIPVMFQFMAPMGRGNNHFFFAVGARFGFNIYTGYEGVAKGNSSCGPVTSSSGQFYLQYTNVWKENESLETSNWPYLGPLYHWDVEGTGKSHYSGGSWGAKLVNVMASAELGFRWKLARGLGLYTGIYADYGIPTINKEENVALVTGAISQNEPGVTPVYENHSILNAQNAPTYWVKKKSGSSSRTVYTFNEIEPVAKAHTLGVGLKMKLAFGKVGRKTPPAPPVLPKPDTLVVIDTIDRFIPVHDTIVVHDTILVNQTVTKTVTVTDTVTVIKEVPVEIQQYMRDLSGGLFKTGSYVLNKSTAVGLNKVADWIKEHPNNKVEIAGYTDSVGSDANNLKLSQLRAKSVYTYLVGKGCDAKMLSYKGYGEADPVADNDTPEGRAANRRVELHILD